MRPSESNGVDRTAEAPYPATPIRVNDGSTLGQQDGGRERGADGAYLVAGTNSGELCWWRVADRTLLATLPGHDGATWAVALSGDGRLVASGGFDGTVRLWETDGGRALATLHGHAGGVWGVALSRDGRLVASGGGDGMVRLWETSSGMLQHALRAQRRYEGLDISGLTGVTEAQRQALLALGAVERNVRQLPISPSET